MGFPTLSCEIAFATDPLAAPSWTDVTSWVRGAKTRRGRQHELGRVEAGAIELLLDNRDRRFDPLHTGGPYSPNVVPMRRVRLRATWDSVTYNLFHGFVTAWPLRYSGPRESVVAVQGFDIFALLALFKLRRYRDEVLADAPVAYWPLDELSGTTATDIASSPAHGTYAGGVTLTDDGPFSGQSGAHLDGTNDEITLATPSKLRLLGDLTIELWFNPDAIAVNQQAALVDSANAQYHVSLGNPPGTSDKVRFDHGNETLSLDPVAVSSVGFPAGSWHHLVITRTGRRIRFYKNAVFDVERLAGRDATNGAFDPNIGAFSGASGYFDGRLGHVAIYDKVLSPERIAAHYAVGIDVVQATDTGTAINAILDAVGWPSSERTIDTGNSTLQSFNPDGSALDVIQKLVESENGLFFGGTDGKASFHSRHSIWKPPHDTSQATFGDGPGELPYTALDPDYDDSDLWNMIRVTREGGEPQLAQDPAARTRYGPRMLERSGLLIASDNEAYDAAASLLSRYKDPVLRFPSITVQGRATDDLWPQILARDIHHDRITVKRRPPGGGDPISTEQHIEGVEHEISPGKFWRTTWALVPADPLTYWLLGDSNAGVLGSTTRLGY